MSLTRSRPARTARLASLTLVVVLGTGCSQSPRVASGTFAQAQHRIVALVNETGAALGSDIDFTPVHSADALPCYKKMFGYTVQHPEADQAEVPVPVAVRTNRDGASLLARVEQYWKSRGYTIDRSGMSDKHYPKLRAHAGADLLVATGYVTLHQINFYGVTPCVRT